MLNPLLFNNMFFMVNLYLTTLFFNSNKMTNLHMLMSWKFSWNLVSNIEFIFLLDWMSLLFAIIVTWVASNVLLFSYSYMKKSKNNYGFHLLIVIFVTSMMLLIFSPNIFSILIGWDGLGVVSFLLILFYQNYYSINSALLTLITNRSGDIFIIMALSILSNAPSLHANFILWNSNSEYAWLAFFLILAAMTKSSQIPFAAWLPAAMAAPTPVSALVHSSTLVTAGIYLLCRFSMILKKDPLPLKTCFFLGSLTMIMGGLSAIYTNDFKKIIAFSTMSQMGLMMTSISCNKTLITFFHMSTHAFFKAMMFIAIGLKIHLNHNEQMIKFMSHTNMNQNFNLIFFSLSHLCLMGFPFVAGFYSKEMIIEKMFDKWSTTPMKILFFIGISLTLVYSWALLLSLWNKMKNFKKQTNFFEKPKKLTNKALLNLWVGTLIIGKNFPSLTFSTFSSPSLPLKDKLNPLILLILISCWWIMKKKKKNLLWALQLYFFSSMMNLSTLPLNLVKKTLNKTSMQLWEKTEMNFINSMFFNWYFNQMKYLKTKIKKNSFSTSQMLMFYFFSFILMF